jgi:GTPase
MGRPPSFHRQDPTLDSPSFVDECTVHVRGGAGGDGSVSIRREKHVPRGGPDGGDGGNGGSVIFVAEERVASLLDLHRRPHRRGEDGRNGAGMRRDGAWGADNVVPVPVGTVIRERDSGTVLADLARPGDRFVAVRGGRGGRGNAAFATRHRRVPMFAENGEKAAERSLRLELKLIADVGLVGFPSAGKSSLVGRLSAATPRVEAWPFTTLTPHLGLMRGGETAVGDPIDVVLADVPGLIEGAAEGKGLGIQFLRHIERCLVLLHVLDAAPFETDRDPVRDLEILREELRKHDPSLLERPQLIVLNKVDLPDGKAMAELIRAQLEEQSASAEETDEFADAARPNVLEVSAISGAGLDTLRFRLGEMVAAERERVGLRTVTPDADAEVTLRPVRRDERDFSVGRDDAARYVVRGERVERWVQMLPLTERDAVRYLQGRLRRAGVEAALIDAGAREGDEVIIGDLVFDFEPNLDDLPAEERDAILAGELDDHDELPDHEEPADEVEP